MLIAARKIATLSWKPRSDLQADKQAEFCLTTSNSDHSSVASSQPERLICLPCWVMEVTYVFCSCFWGILWPHQTIPRIFFLDSASVLYLNYFIINFSRTLQNWWWLSPRDLIKLMVFITNVISAGKPNSVMHRFYCWIMQYNFSKCLLFSQCLISRAIPAHYFVRSRLVLHQLSYQFCEMQWNTTQSYCLIK